jgi:hypothetical protein
MRLPSGATILDPWNGAGTTTEAGAAHGYSVHGYDINPVMVLVAKARLLTSTVLPSIDPICSDILRKARRATISLLNDPIEAWLSPATTASIRRIEISIQRLLVPAPAYVPIISRGTLDAVSSLAAFYYTALFKTLRLLLSPLRGSNPTWFPQGAPKTRLRLSEAVIHRTFAAEVRRLAQALDSGIATRTQVTGNIELAASSALPMAEASVDAVVCSPPYCTRLDYAIATTPELAVLGADHAAIRRLRDAMIGSPTISSGSHNIATHDWGRTCAHFLRRVREHPSKASGGYYSKVFLSYFAGMSTSLRELARIAKPSAPVILVVQDSYYKDVRNDLATILSEMARSVGFSLEHRDDFVVGTSLRSINTRSRAYHRNCAVIESALLFRRTAASYTQEN